MNNTLIPVKLDDFILNKDIAERLNSVSLENVVNMMFIGKPNTGRKTLIYAFLNSIHNCNIYKLKTLNSLELKIGNNKVNIEYVSSPYHIEINLYEYGLYDKNIISDFIMEQISYKPINNRPYKFIIINHFDYVSKSSQICLKLLLDKASVNVRFIFISDSATKIDTSILSRVATIRVPVLDKSVLQDYISVISKTKYKISLTHQKLILQHSNSDLFVINNALMGFHYNKKLEFSQINIIDKYITDIVDNIVKQDLKSIAAIRNIAYNLLLINITIPYVLKKVYNCFMISNKFNDKIKIKITEVACSIQTSMSSIEHDLICLEFFALKVKKLLITN
jgi:replication factor C subunit 3/5